MPEFLKRFTCCSLGLVDHRGKVMTSTSSCCFAGICHEPQVHSAALLLLRAAWYPGALSFCPPGWAAGAAQWALQRRRCPWEKPSASCPLAVQYAIPDMQQCFSAFMVLHKFNHAVLGIRAYIHPCLHICTRTCKHVHTPMLIRQQQ